MRSSSCSSLERYVAQILLSEEAWHQYQRGDVSHALLAPYVNALRALSTSYTSHSVGNKLTKEIGSDLEASAYALYYLSINAAKIEPLLSLLTPTKRPIRVLDFGCGPATASLALLFNLPPDLMPSVNLHCVDSSAAMRSVARRLLGDARTSAHLSDLEIGDTINAGDFDLIFVSNVLAEMDHTQAQILLESMIERLTPHGSLFIMEPGQQAHTRRLMQLRDHIILRSPDITPLFPCHRRDACPMLMQSSQDWCHGAIEWQQPPLSRQIDRLLGFNKHRIKFAAFLFQRGSNLRPGSRVLTQPRKTPRGIETLVCGDGHYGLLTIRKRARQSSNRALEKARIFDRLVFSEPIVGEVPTTVDIRTLSI